MTSVLLFGNFDNYDVTNFGSTFFIFAALYMQLMYDICYICLFLCQNQKIFVYNLNSQKTKGETTKLKNVELMRKI